MYVSSYLRCPTRCLHLYLISETANLQPPPPAPIPMDATENGARIFKRLWSPGIDSKELIPPAYVAWRAGTIALFLLGF